MSKSRNPPPQPRDERVTVEAGGGGDVGEQQVALVAVQRVVVVGEVGDEQVLVAVAVVVAEVGAHPRLLAAVAARATPAASARSRKRPARR